MMTRELTVAIAAVLATLAEVDGGPESSAYLALGCDWNLWERTKSILINVGWMTESNNWLAITPAGREMAEKLF